MPDELGVTVACLSRRQRIFAIDVGGTNARFSCFFLYGGRLSLETAVWSRSDDMVVTDDLLAALRHLLPMSPEPGDALAVALAGPVCGLQGRLTNGRLQVDLRSAKEQMGLRCCLLLNDFMAEAWGTLTPGGETAGLVHGRTESTAPKATRAVLGAGTGLGAASLVWAGSLSPGRWMALPSEAGHAPFAFEGDEEQAYQRFLTRHTGYAHITAEHVLSGTGLSLLHFYLSGQNSPAQVVGQTALSCESPTLLWYGRFLGRFCRQWMCSTLCRGGLWITGGIPARNPLCVTARSFSQELTLGPAAVETLPVRLVNDTNSGLWGAAYAASHYLCVSG